MLMVPLETGVLPYLELAIIRLSQELFAFRALCSQVDCTAMTDDQLNVLLIQEQTIQIKIEEITDALAR